MIDVIHMIKLMTINDVRRAGAQLIVQWAPHGGNPLIMITSRRRNGYIRSLHIDFRLCLISFVNTK